MLDVNFYDTAKVVILFLFRKFVAQNLTILQKMITFVAQIKTEMA